MVFISKLKYT